MALETLRITEPKVLVVEGKDELYFFEALISHLGLPNIQVMDIGGKTQLRARLEALAMTPGFTKVTSLGIVRDANDDYPAAFQSVCGALRNTKLPVPERPLEPVGNERKVAVMILPKENEPGMLEAVCLEAVVSDPATPCLEQYFRCLQEQRLSLPRGRSISKAKVQAFLASRSEPSLWLGVGAKKGYWPWQNNAFDQVKTFLQQL